MIAVTPEIVATYSLSTRMIITQALARGWSVRCYYPGSSHLVLQPAGRAPINIFGSTAPKLSYVACRASENKLITNAILADNGFPLPFTLRIETEAELPAALEAVLRHSKAVVIKPVNAAHGDGVATGVQSLDQAVEAYRVARQYSRNVIMQEHLADRIDLRILCIDYKFQAALIRKPGQIIGNGEHTIRELIEHVNSQPNRGVNYTRELNKINLEAAIKYLGSEIDSVPEDGEDVQVIGTANVGTGGETEDVTDELPGWLKAMAEGVSRTMELQVAGVDILVTQRPTPSSTESDLQPAVLEVNKSPALFIHETVTVGTKRPVIDAFLDFIEKTN